MARKFDLSREFISELRQAIGDNNEKNSLRLIDDFHAADIAELYRELDIEEVRYLYLLLDGELASDVLAELDDDDRERFLKLLPGEVIAQKFIDYMDSDDAADIIGDLDEEKKQEVLLHLDDVEQAGDIVDLLAYDENTAGGLMGKEMVLVNENWTILTCLKELGKQADEVDEVYYLYVVNDGKILLGIVSLKKMLLSNNSMKVKSIIEDDIISVPTDASSEEVAQIMEKYDLVAIPVVDSIGRLVGRITIDDIVDVIREEAEKDYQMASGLIDEVESGDKVFTITRARLPWLLIGLAGGILGALVLGRFETSLKIYPEMAFFIPLIAAMGGNVGIQSSAIIVQGLANNTLKTDRTFQRLAKEFFVALLNGLILALLIFIYNYFVSDSFALTITVSVSLISVVVFAALFGTTIPLILNRYKIDPALATGPFITTMNDIIGLLIYMLIGRGFYAMFTM
ncbi:MAG: magnesium transporter [Marinilabiliaceae bacterium]|jgi:magnesium transporter|nr:magnesium transporter [Marinilabiliaceae bacterium]